MLELDLEDIFLLPETIYILESMFLTKEYKS
jgi:hypothetical protein